MTEKQLKYLEEKGLIKTLDDAPTDDWPEGFLEKCYVIGEPVIRYFKYHDGDIVLVKKYKYKNGKIGTNHLFVIFGDDGCAIPSEYFSVILSSKIHKIKYKDNYMIYRNENNGLFKDSIIKLDVIYKIEEKNISGKVGRIDDDMMIIFKEKYQKLLLSEVK